MQPLNCLKQSDYVTFSLVESVLSVFVLDGTFLSCADCGKSQLTDEYISEIKTAMTRCQYALEQAKNLKAEGRKLKLHVSLS